MRIIKISYIITFYLILLMNSFIYADYSAKTNKKIDIRKEKTIEARLTNGKGTIKGIIEETTEKLYPYSSSKNEQGINFINVKIVWTDLITSKGISFVNNLYSNLQINGNIIKPSTTVLIKGNIENIKNDETNIKSKDKKEISSNNNRYVPSSTSGTGGTTNITTPVPSSDFTSSIPSSNLKALEKPSYITTYDGCNQVYDKNKEIIQVSQRTYYIDKDNKEHIVKQCSKIKEYPAEKQNCSISIDMENKIVYPRYQPYFTENKTKYAASGCVLSNPISLYVDYSVCDTQVIGDKYIKKGKWYYQEKTGEKEYLSGCILDPEKNELSLLVQYKGCPVVHFTEQNFSKYSGKYYRIREDNSKEILTNCVENKDGTFKHLLQWNTDQWHFDYDKTGGFRQKIMTRFIKIPTENREEIITDSELDPVKIYDLNFDYNICDAVLSTDAFQYLQQGKWYYTNPKGEKTYISKCIPDPKAVIEDLFVEYKNCPVTHNLESNVSIYFAKYYRLKANQTKEILSNCLETKKSKFPHLFRWNEGKWLHNKEGRYSQRILVRYISIPTENREIIIQEKDVEQEHYKQYTKGINDNIEWIHYDDKSPHNISSGYSIPKIKWYVQFQGKEYFTGLTTLGEKKAHKVIENKWTKGQKCGLSILGANKYFYLYIVERPDGTTYTTNEYDTGCNN